MSKIVAAFAMGIVLFLISDFVIIPFLNDYFHFTIISLLAPLSVEGVFEETSKNMLVIFGLIIDMVFGAAGFIGTYLLLTSEN